MTTAAFGHKSSWRSVSPTGEPFTLRRAEEVDRRKVYETYLRWPRLAKEGYGVRVDLPRRQFASVCVLGMGGSAAGGDILAGWLGSVCEIDLRVFKGVIPPGEMRGALAIACSASGETRETISMMKTAVKRGATVVSISHSGRLERESLNLGVPHVKMPDVVAPRYVLPFMVFACLAVIDQALKLGKDAEASEALAEMAKTCGEVDLARPQSKNPSKRLAAGLLGRSPLIYGTRITRGPGIRFKNVLAENAKQPSSYEEMPEAFHNVVEAWEDESNTQAAVFLRHTLEEPGLRRRGDDLFTELGRLGRQPLEVKGCGRSSLAQLMTMVYRLDMASYYLALGKGKDPLPTPFIDRLKK